MDEKVRQFLKSREKDFELLQNGKVRCLVTNHEMPARIEDLQKHVAGKKFKMQKECYSVDFSKYAPDIVPSKKPKKLWCKVTQMQLNAIPEEVEKHINGRKFKAAKAQRELLKEAKKKKLEELQPEDGPDVSLFADALSDSLEFDSDPEEPSSSKEEAEGEEEVEEKEEAEEEEEGVVDPFASDEDNEEEAAAEEAQEEEEVKKPEKKQMPTQPKQTSQPTKPPQKTSQPQNGKQNHSHHKTNQPKKQEETKNKPQQEQNAPQQQQPQKKKFDGSKKSKAAEHLPHKESNNKKKQKK